MQTSKNPQEYQYWNGAQINAENRISIRNLYLTKLTSPVLLRSRQKTQYWQNVFLSKIVATSSRHFALLSIHSHSVLKADYGQSKIMVGIFKIPWVLFEKSLSLYFDWTKSWIWRTLEKVMNIFCKWHFHNASKGVFWPKKFLNFMHGFKSAILAEWNNCQNSTFIPVHEI